MTLKFDLPEGFFPYDGSGIPVSPDAPVWVVLRMEDEFDPAVSFFAGLYGWEWNSEHGPGDDIVAYAVAPDVLLQWGDE